MKKLLIILSLVMIAGICISAPRKARRRLQLAASGAFSPLDVSDCKLWLDADDSATVLGVSTAVTNWIDKSTEGNNAVQIGADTTRPTVVAADQNGLDVISFDGGDYLSTGFINSSNITVFCMMEVDFQGIGTIMGARDVTATRSAIASGDGDSDLIYFAIGGRFGNRAYGNTLVYTALTMSHGGGNGYLYRNGTETVNFTYTGSPINSTQDYYIGNWNDKGAPGSYYFNGDIGEIIIYDRVISATERGQVSDYLTDKWGL